MSINNRLFWGIEAIGVAVDGSQAYTSIHGVQSVGITTNFNLEPVLELGQVSIYENIEEIPDVEVTIEKVLDGYPLIYHLMTQGAPSADMMGRANQKSALAMSLFADTQQAASGVPIAQVTMSGLYPSSVGYTFPVTGNCTESVTAVGNDRVWALPASTTYSGGFLNTDVPLAQTYASGGIQRRQNLLFSTAGLAALDVNSQFATSKTSPCTILPPIVPGINASGANVFDGQKYACAIQNIAVTADLGRDKILELGHKHPYYRFVTLPVNISTEIEIINKSGDWINAKEVGPYINGANTPQCSISIATQDGTYINLGTRNRLSNIAVGGGDTGGANSTLTFSFTTLNDFTVQHPQDPSGL